MLTKRTVVNVIVFFLLAGFLIFLGLNRFILSQEGGRTVNVTFANAQGLLPRDDVTVRGVPSGAISDVTLKQDGTTTVAIALDPDITVTKGSTAAITRRSPIGDLVVDITPGHGGVLPSGATIPVQDTTQPPDPEKTIEELNKVFSAVPPAALHDLVHELAIALNDRGKDLASLSVSGRELPQQILTVRDQLISLIHNGPKILDTLAANSRTLAQDITLTADLATILKDRRFDLVSLSANGARFAEVANELLSSEKPNLACLLGDFAHVNGTLAKQENLKNLIDVLDLNHYFFGGVAKLVQQSTTNPYKWFRVFFLPPQQPPGRQHAARRSPPDVYGADSCRSMYGAGVGPARQNPPPKLTTGSRVHYGN
jgi:phospholipid/cholesterol/gamma-HCH transport system substrate-binding protein